MSIAFEGLKEDKYRIGDLQAIRYNRTQPPFYDEWLVSFYDQCRESQILDRVFGGNPPSTFESIVSYLASKPLIVMGEWTEEGFKEAGFAFLILPCGTPQTELSAFCGFGFLKHVWGQPELPVLAMLGLTHLFQEFNLKAIHGTRYPENVLAARFMSQFGMRDIGTIPDYQLRDGKLVPAVVSTLSRSDFEKYVEEFLVAQYRESLHSQPDSEPTAAEPEKPKEVPQLSLSWL